MKYIRNAIAILLTVIFVAALAVGLSMIFAVRNINVLRLSYVTDDSTGSNEFSRAADGIEETLSSLKGGSIFFIEESDITEAFEGYGYAGYISFEKIYPSTVNVTIKEKLEVFTIMSEEGLWDVYDIDMNYISTKDSNVNNIDGAPNVLVSISDATQADYEAVASAASVISSYEGLSAIRSFVESISVTVNEAEESWNTLDIALRCGLTMSIMGYTEYTAEKAEALLDEFLKLEDYQKLSGTLTCIRSVTGSYIVDFVA